MLPVMDVSVISLDEDPSLFGRRDPSSERRVKKDGLKKVPEFNSKCVADTAKGRGMSDIGVIPYSCKEGNLRDPNFLRYLNFSCFDSIAYSYFLSSSSTMLISREFYFLLT